MVEVITVKDSKITGLIIIASLISFIVFFAIIVNNENNKKKEIETTVNNCIEYMCNKGDGNYFKYAAGDVLFKIHNNNRNNGVEMEGIKIEDLKINGDYCSVKCKTDLKLADGSFDVFWQDMELINKGSWRVVGTRASKVALDKEQKGKKYDTDIFIYILKEFVKEYNKDKELATKKYTAGELRQNIEHQKEIIEDKFGEIEIKEIRGINRGELTAKVDIKYVIEEKEVNNLFTFYRTKEGWKITEIQSSFFKEGK